MHEPHELPPEFDWVDDCPDNLDDFFDDSPWMYDEPHMDTLWDDPSKDDDLDDWDEELPF